MFHVHIVLRADGVCGDSKNQESKTRGSDASERQPAPRLERRFDGLTRDRTMRPMHVEGQRARI